MSKKMGGLGIRMAREANTSLLGTLVWDLQKRSSKLWVEVLTHKYGSEGCFLDERKKPGSCTWNLITKAKAVLKDGFCMRLGNGNSFFWYDSWSLIGHIFAP